MECKGKDRGCNRGVLDIPSYFPCCADASWIGSWMSWETPLTWFCSSAKLCLADVRRVSGSYPKIVLTIVGRFQLSKGFLLAIVVIHRVPIDLFVLFLLKPSKGIPTSDCRSPYQHSKQDEREALVSEHDFQRNSPRWTFIRNYGTRLEILIDKVEYRKN